MQLDALVRKYVATAGGYGMQLPLASLGLSKQEIEDSFGAFDEDYHISRFLHFACLTDDIGSAGNVRYQINGFPQTHLSIDSEVQSIL
jgi:hypothetical protein